jgi:hypothetical protein
MRDVGGTGLRIFYAESDFENTVQYEKNLTLFSPFADEHQVYIP